ncbi:MAG TPA: O-antigen ligase family protein [Polyangia bacterium]|nr:O-antigen ligase family protein [Polyangia bacterium]
MFAIPGILALVTLIYVRPQEFAEAARSLPLLYLALGLTVFGLVVDWRLRLSRLELAPQVPWIGIFFAWSMLTVMLRNPPMLGTEALAIGVAIVLALSIMHGVQTLRAFQVVAAVVLGCTLFLSVIGVAQSFAPYTCMAIDESASEPGRGHFDGRPCESFRDCQIDAPEPGADYRCERAGVLGTSTIGGRVRYIGVLEDPNFLALTIGCGLPFAFALAERKRSPPRRILLWLALVLCMLCAIVTKSRGGQIVFLVVIGTYLIKRYGPRGLLLGALLALPLLLFGGRSGEEAESSTLERLECWFEGMTMVRDYPIVGVGAGQFLEHHYQAAHNSYIQAPAELGLPGMVWWSSVLYLSAKIPVQALRRYASEPRAAAARTWAMALLASLAGLVVGIMFLSFCYHYVLWIYVGLAGAFHGVLRTHDPEWRVRFDWRDLARVVVIDLLLVVGLYGYTRIKMM